MDESHDQNYTRKIAKIWSKACVFCCEKYPIPTTILILFFLLYLFFPLVFKISIYSFPLVGIFLLVHRHFSRINQQKVKQLEDERRKKFAKSRRSFKSVYNDRNHLIRRKNLNKHGDYNDTKDDDDDDIFFKSLSDLLMDKKSKGTREVSLKSVAGKGESSSLNDNANANFNKEVSKDDDKPQDLKVVRWTADDQKNGTDLGLSEAERTKRLQSMMQRRRSRKNLGFEEEGSTGNNNNVQISSVKTTKINPFLEVNSSGKKSPGSAPSSLVTTSNPFDLPYDPHEEKLDLTGDNFHEEFTVVQPKEPVFCRHQSFSLGAFADSVIAREDSSNKQKSVTRFGTSTLDTGDDNKHIQHDSPVSDDSIDNTHPNEKGASSERAVGVLNEEDGTEKNPEETDSFDERKADINFFYGINKKAYHVASNSIVSDLQVELSDEDNVPTLDDQDIEKERERSLNSSDPQEDSEMNENPKPVNSEPMQSNRIHEPNGANQSSVARAAPDGLAELATGQASVSSSSSSSSKPVLQPEYSADPASSHNVINEARQSDNHSNETESADSVLHQTNDAGEHPFRDRDIDNLQDHNVRRV